MDSFCGRGCWDNVMSVENNHLTKPRPWAFYFLNCLLLCDFALVLARTWWPIHLPGNAGWPEAVLLLLATAATLAALTRHLPLQNTLSAAALIALAGSATTWLDLDTGIPFGVFKTNDRLGPEMFQTLPWIFPFLWVAMILNSRGVGRLILRPWRKTRVYGFWLIGFTAGLTMLFDLAFEPYAVRVQHYWYWEPGKLPLTWQSVPLTNFPGWAVVTLLILAFVTPMLINKQPAPRQRPDLHPLALWLGAVVLFGLCAARTGLWSATALDGVIGIVTAFFAIRGAQW
jgi:uncharacterized membrane protein